MDQSLVVQVKPNKKARAEIHSAARSLPVAERTWRRLREITGYPTTLIQEVLKKAPVKPKPVARPRNVPSEARPIWVMEIMENTGLDMVKVRKFHTLEEWLLLAPTGVPIIRLIGTGDLVQSSTKIPHPASVLQGLTTLEIDRRKKANTRRRKT